jgi:hypothetical protein
MRTTMFLFAALTTVMAVSNSASAQPVDNSDAGKADDAKPETAPSGGGICSSADVTCQDAYKMCLGQKGDAETSRDAFASNLAFCENADLYCKDPVHALEERCKNRKAPTPSKPKPPVKFTCEGVEASKPQQDGNDCKCGHTDYVAVTRIPYRVKVCVSTKDTDGLFNRIHKLEMDTAAQKAATEALGQWATKEDERVTQLLREIEDLYKLLLTDPRGAANRFDRMQDEIDRITTDVRVIKKALGDICGPDWETKGCKAIRRPPFDSGIGVKGGALFLPGAGPTGFVGAEYRQAFWFSPDGPGYVRVNLNLGRVFNSSIGPASVAGGGAGVGFCLTEDCMHNLDVSFQVRHIFSDHDAGYNNGTLKTSGMATSAMGEVEYHLDFARFARFQVFGGLGWAKANTFAGPDVLNKDSGVAGVIGAGLQLHIDFGGGK